MRENKNHAQLPKYLFPFILCPKWPCHGGITFSPSVSTNRQLPEKEMLDDNHSLSNWHIENIIVPIEHQAQKVHCSFQINRKGLRVGLPWESLSCKIRILCAWVLKLVLFMLHVQISNISTEFRQQKSNWPLVGMLKAAASPSQCYVVYCTMLCLCKQHSF